MESTYTQLCKFMMQKSAYLNVLITQFQESMTMEQHPISIFLKTVTDHNIMILSFSVALGFKISEPYSAFGKIKNLAKASSENTLHLPHGS